MTDRSKKITELTALTNASGDDLLVIVDSPAANAETKKITLANFFANVSSNAVFKSTLNANGRLLVTGSVPANSSANGTTGQIAFDSNYIYCCVSTNTWKRSALTSW